MCIVRYSHRFRISRIVYRVSCVVYCVSYIVSVVYLAYHRYRHQFYMLIHTSIFVTKCTCVESGKRNKKQIHV